MAKRGFSSKSNPPPAARFECRMPDKPDDLSEYEGRMWDKYSEMLFRAGTLDESNGELLRSLCEWLEVKRDYKKELDRKYDVKDKDGNVTGRRKMLVYKTKAGGLQVSAYERGLRNATLEVNKLLDYFGATPKTRDRVHTYRKEAQIVAKPVGEIEPPKVETIGGPVTFESDFSAELDAQADQAMNEK